MLNVIVLLLFVKICNTNCNEYTLALIFKKEDNDILYKLHIAEKMEKRSTLL